MHAYLGFSHIYLWHCLYQYSMSKIILSLRSLGICDYEISCNSLSFFFRKQSLKDCFHDGNGNPIKIKQSCLHHTRALKGTGWICHNKVNVWQNFWRFVTCWFLNSIPTKIFWQKLPPKRIITPSSSTCLKFVRIMLETPKLAR